MLYWREEQVYAEGMSLLIKKSVAGRRIKIKIQRGFNL